jgi:hypothetical protein
VMCSDAGRNRQAAAPRVPHGGDRSRRRKLGCVITSAGLGDDLEVAMETGRFGRSRPT